MWVTWDHHQWTVLQCLQCCFLYIPTHTNAFNYYIQSTHTQTHTRIHHSPLKSSVVSDVSDLRPSPMYCAPTSPILLSVHPNTHKRIQSTHTHTHNTSLTSQIQCCKWCKWLETITNGLCSNVSNFVVCTPQQTQTHSINTQTHTHTRIHHSLLKFSAVSDVSDLRPSPMDCAPTCPMLLPVHPNKHKRIQLLHTINTHTHTRIHHSPFKFSDVRDVSDLRPSPMDCAPMSPTLLSVHPNTHKRI